MEKKRERGALALSSEAPCSRAAAPQHAHAKPTHNATRTQHKRTQTAHRHNRTENGVSVPGEADLPRAAALRDAFRTNYYRDYINQLCRSKRDGAKITAYMAWSLMDNFEWLRGYSERFGITHVDFDSQERSVKDSGRYLSRHFFTVN